MDFKKITMLDYIRKFGLEHCSLSSMMWNVSFVLRALTLNIGIGRDAPVIFYILTVIAAGCYFYVYVVCMVWFVFWRCTETGDVLAALLVFSLGIASEIGPVKLIYTKIYISKIRNIVKTSLAIDALLGPGDRFSINLQKTLRKVKIRAIFFWIMIMGNGLVYIVKPFVTPGRHLIEDLFIYYGLEPMYETPNYEIALVVTIFGVLFCCYTTASITAFVIVNVGYVEAQMLSWSEELQLLWSDAKHFHFKNYIQTPRFYPTDVVSDYKITQATLNEFVHSHLKVIIRGHAKNLNLVKQIDDFFKTVAVIEIFILVIALIAELLGGLENTYMEVPFSFIQVAMDCLTGQRLADASLVFERAVFECRWENFDSSNRKLVLMMLQSSQKTMTLSAGGFAMLNFSFMMSVVQSIYSTYTTLRSFVI